MSGVDDRIVAMKFDNETFSKKVADTIQSLDKLRQSLDFTNSKRSLDDLASAGKNFNMDGLSSSIEGVSGKFIALATIGITALANITNRAISAGSAFLNSFTFAPIQDGFREFETNINSIQTILANTDSKGTTLQNVNDALAQLNAYADQTIYNFSQMTRNIGTFTAAGIDLDTSVSAIKGIANLAAISGSNAEQAATAMYQLSQAMASGTVKLMDWNSVVNAGMGGEVFQKALFETGKQMKTIAGVPMSMTFEEWKKAGNSFRGSLEQGWITAEVLTNTLQGFTGDLTEAQILSMGYTQEQAKEIMRLGKIGLAAATEVKTLTQLLGTVKEAIGSGWSKSFQIIIGNFEESKALFTSISNGIGRMVGESADARNKILQDFADLGGRHAIVGGLQGAIKALASVLNPIRDAFRDIFPPITGQRLSEMAEAFSKFTHSLILGEETMEKIKRAFRGLFGVLEIGWTVIKEVFSLFKDLVKAILPVGSTLLDFGAGTGDMLAKLNEALVAGGGIHDFFIKLREVIAAPIAFIGALKEKILDFFGSGDAADTASESFGRVGSRFEMLSDTANKVSEAWQRLTERFQGVFEVLDKVLDYITNWFSELGGKLAAAFKPGDFDAAVDIVNVGLLGGIAIMLKKFLSGGLKLDLSGGLIEKLKGIFDGLTGTLKAMQTNLKAEALLKIAAALGILTASIVVLSLIDSAALTKALTAMTVSFGELVGAMTLMDKLVGSAGAAAKLAIVGAALMEIAAAMVILSIAVKIMSSMDLGELAKGLVGVGAGLGILAFSTQLIAADTGGLIRAGIAMGFISAALVILSLAVKSFGSMSWEDMAKGLIGIAVALGVITLAMKLMPVGSTIAAGLAMIPLAVGLTILAGAVKLFALMSWEEMGKGMVGIAGALLIIAGAMHLMPLTLPVTAAGLLILSVALNAMALAIKLMGANDLETLAKGLGTLAIMLGILVISMNLMNSAIGGAASLVIVSGALLVLTHVIKELGSMDLMDIVKGLGAIAAVLVVLGLGALLLQPVIPAMFALGAALALVGAGFALFGLGAMLVAKAIEVMAKSGVAGIRAIVDGILGLGQELIEAVPLLIRLVTAILDQFLDTVIQLTPKIAQAFKTIIIEGLKAIQETFPEILETGYQILITIIRGIRDNIDELLTTGKEMVLALVDSLVKNMPEFVNSAAELIISFVDELSKHAEDLVTAGLNLLIHLLNGITDNIDEVADAVVELITTFLSELAKAQLQIISAGVSILLFLLQGISDNIIRVVDGVSDIVIAFIGALANKTNDIIAAGFKLLTDFLKGIGDNIIEVVDTVADIITTFITEIGNKALDIADAGAKIVVKFLEGVGRDVTAIMKAGTDLAITILKGAADNAVDFTNRAADVLIKFLNGMAEAVRTHSKELRDAGINLVSAIIDGMTFGLSGKVQEVLGGHMGDITDKLINDTKKKLGISSPSKVFMKIGQNVIDGFSIGLKKNKEAIDNAGNVSEQIVSRIQESLNKLPAVLSDMDNFNPVITPVLDLTKVEAASNNLQKFMQLSPLTPEASLAQARLISTSTLDQATNEVPGATGVTEINFNQNNYSPEALSVNDIYRKTKSQIAIVKEELNIG